MIYFVVFRELVTLDCLHRRSCSLNLAAGQSSEDARKIAEEAINIVNLPEDKVKKHMRWPNANLKASVLALLGGGELSPAALEDRIEDIRVFILAELGGFAEENYPKLVRNVTYAQDAQGLWYTRGEVMAVLADMHGETIAREKIERISDKFRGLLPRGLSSRPSTLTTH